MRIPRTDTRALNVGEVCKRDVATVQATTSIMDAAEELRRRRTEVIVAVASPAARPTVLGIVTDGDILDAMLSCGGLDSRYLSVLDVLPRNPLVLNEGEDCAAAIAKLRDRGLDHAAVVGMGGTLLGAVSLEDLLECKQSQSRTLANGSRTRVALQPKAEP